MSDEMETLDSLRTELMMADAALDAANDELRFLYQDFDALCDLVYDAMVLLESCDSCREDSLKWFEGRIRDSNVRRALVEFLYWNDMKNGRLLQNAGLDLESWRREENENEGW